jgi:L-threonine-O-3-phosphate decarboxylase
MATQPTHGGNLRWAASVAHCAPEEILDFSASINPLGPPPSVLAALTGAIADLRHYPDPEYQLLRGAIAQYHHLEADWILPGNGAAELLTWAAWDLAVQPPTVLFTPSFADYDRALNAFNVAVRRITLPLDHCPEKLPLPSTQTGGLLLNNPHNPTGYQWSRAAILPWLEQFALVVIDEAFMDFLPPDEQSSLIADIEQFPNLVILRSLTKFYSVPGLRLGYAIAHPERLKQWQKRRDPWAVNQFAAVAGEAMLNDRVFQAQTWDWLPPTRAQLYQDLAAMPGLNPLPGRANFLLIKTARSSSELQQELLQRDRILVRDCVTFPELRDRYIRVAVRSTADNLRLVEGLAAILA